MGRTPTTQAPVKLFFALMSGQSALFAHCEKLLSEEFGAIDLRDDPYAFDPMTNFYAKEFGSGLQKKILSTERLIEPEALVRIKLRTNEMEEELTREHKPDETVSGRIINIDPGYLSYSKIILASTKDHLHRIYIGQGIFEEITLLYQRIPGRYSPNPWTYRDYRCEERIDFFALMRETYIDQLKQTP